MELVEPDGRETRNPELIAAWRERIEPPPGMESLSLVEQRGGPSGRDIVVNLTGDDAGALKAAALDLAAVLAAAAGVSGVEDDLPFGQEQLVYRLTPQASAPRADRGPPWASSFAPPTTGTSRRSSSTRARSWRSAWCCRTRSATTWRASAT